MKRIRFGYSAFTSSLVAGAAFVVGCSNSGTSSPDNNNGFSGSAGFQSSGGFQSSSGGGGFGNFNNGATGNVPIGSGGFPQSSGGGSGAFPASGGVTASGGAPAATGGSVSIGGQTNVTDIKIVGTVTQCPNTTPTLPQGTLGTCNLMGCMAAHCVPSSDVPAGGQMSTALLSTCTDGSFCTPDDYIATDDQFLAKKCTSLLGAEGRCISTCVTEVNQQMGQLPVDVCDMATERCAPCFSPIDGSDTKACSQGCDTGPANTTPIKFPQCGNGLGLCVPKSLVPAAQQNAVPKDSCSGPDSGPDDMVCAPVENVKDIKHTFPSCTPSFLDPLGLDKPNSTGQKGACVPAFIVSDMNPPPLMGAILQDSCQSGYLCAPCLNPTSTPANQPTGACPP